MKQNKDGEYIINYEKEDIDGFILKLLEENPNGITYTELMSKMPKDLNKNTVGGFLLLLVNSGEILPEWAFRLNKGQTLDSKFAGIFNDRIMQSLDETYNYADPTDKTTTGDMG